MVRTPTAFADFQVVLFCFYRLFAKFGQLEALPATIALGDRVLAGGEPVTHLRTASDEHLAGHEPHRRLLAVLVHGQLPRLIVLRLEDGQPLNCVRQL